MVRGCENILLNFEIRIKESRDYLPFLEGLLSCSTYHNVIHSYIVNYNQFLNTIIITLRKHILS